jgi:hypothetical protein
VWTVQLAQLVGIAGNGVGDGEGEMEKDRIKREGNGEKDGSLV